MLFILDILGGITMLMIKDILGLGLMVLTWDLFLCVMMWPS